MKKNALRVLLVVLVLVLGVSVAISQTSTTKKSATTAASSAAKDLVDINSATKEQLDALPGIGPATAAAIVRDREQHGPFHTVDDLSRVRGIGPAKLAQLHDLVTV